MPMTYREAVHALERGIKIEVEQLDSKETSVKQLRLELVIERVKHDALVGLLIRKNLITEEEYRQMMVAEMNREVRRYERDIEQKAGRRINL